MPASAGPRVVDAGGGRGGGGWPAARGPRGLGARGEAGPVRRGWPAAEPAVWGGRGGRVRERGRAGGGPGGRWRDSVLRSASKRGSTRLARSTSSAVSKATAAPARRGLRLGRVLWRAAGCVALAPASMTRSSQLSAGCSSLSLSSTTSSHRALVACCCVGAAGGAASLAGVPEVHAGVGLSGEAASCRDSRMARARSSSSTCWMLRACVCGKTSSATPSWLAAVATCFPALRLTVVQRGPVVCG
jgi:hypothetical protein